MTICLGNDFDWIYLRLFELLISGCVCVFQGLGSFQIFYLVDSQYSFYFLLLQEYLYYEHLVINGIQYFMWVFFISFTFFFLLIFGWSSYLKSLIFHVRDFFLLLLLKYSILFFHFTVSIFFLKNFYLILLNEFYLLTSIFICIPHWFFFISLIYLCSLVSCWASLQSLFWIL